MYPLPRILISAALLLAVVYGVLALVLLLPKHQGLLVAVYGLPFLVPAIVIAFFARGEPNDQTEVHLPPVSTKHPRMSRADWRMSEAEFEALEDTVDSSATADQHRPHASDDDGFSELVRQAIDDLPPKFIHALDHVAIVVSDQGSVQRINGRRQPLYGLYIGYASRGSFVIGAPSRSALPDRIVIFRDTLTHDYGHDRQQLRAAVTRTLCHELAHHLGWDEKGVAALGL